MGHVNASKPVMAFLQILIFFFFIETHLSLSISHNQNQPISDIHDLLPSFNLPIGIIPNNVDSYTLSSDGTFQVILSRPCYVQFDQLVYYEKVIKGKLKIGSVSNVVGIQAKKLFLWLDVTGMDVDSVNDMVEFHVGAFSQKLPAKQFDVVPTCKNKNCVGIEHEGLVQAQ